MDARHAQAGRGRPAPYVARDASTRDAVLAASVGIDWRPLVGLGHVPDPRDQIERVITHEVIKQARELRVQEIEHGAHLTAHLLAGGG